MKKIKLTLLFIATVFGVNAQEPYDDCDQALELCNNTLQSVNNLNATTCSSCEDDFTTCFNLQNTIWLSFTTDADGGDVNLNFSNINFQNGSGFDAVLLEAGADCDPQNFTEVSNCISNITVNTVLNGAGLLPNQEYFVLMNGSNGAEFNMDVLLTGNAVDAANSDLVISYDSPTICYGEEATIFSTVNNCNSNEISWFVNGNLIETNTDNEFTINTLNDGDVVSATVNCIENCAQITNSNTITFTVNGYTLDAGPDRTIKLGESAQLNASTNAPTFTWFPTIGLDYPDLIKPFVQPDETTTYTLTVTDGSCISTDEVTVFVEAPLDISNTFTPNNDGVNDTWEIVGIESFPNCRVEIFNRWGQSIFQTTGYNKDEEWDGTFKGNTVPSGVFYYVIYLTNEKDAKPIKGHVNLIR